MDLTRLQARVATEENSVQVWSVSRRGCVSFPVFSLKLLCLFTAQVLLSAEKAAFCGCMTYLDYSRSEPSEEMKAHCRTAPSPTVVCTRALLIAGLFTSIIFCTIPISRDDQVSHFLRVPRCKLSKKMASVSFSSRKLALWRSRPWRADDH